MPARSGMNNWDLAANKKIRGEHPTGKLARILQ